MHGFNPNNPADHETVAFEHAGNTIARMAKKGICAHGWIGPNVPGKLDGEFKCFHCNKVFPSKEDAYRAYEDFMQQYN